MTRPSQIHQILPKRLLLLPVIGVVLTIASAWFGACIEPANTSFPDPRSWRSIAGVVLEKQLGVASIRSTLLYTECEVTDLSYGDVAPATRDQWVAEGLPIWARTPLLPNDSTPTPREIRRSVTIAYGWPMRSLFKWYRSSPSSLTKSYELQLSQSTQLPMLPHGAGLCVDVIFWSGASAIFVFVYCKLLKYRRGRYRRCTECGYDLRGLSSQHMCPECGNRVLLK